MVLFLALLDFLQSLLFLQWKKCPSSFYIVSPPGALLNILQNLNSINLYLEFWLLWWSSFFCLGCHERLFFYFYFFFLWLLLFTSHHPGVFFCKVFIFVMSEISSHFTALINFFMRLCLFQSPKSWSCISFLIPSLNLITHSSIIFIISSSILFSLLAKTNLK